MLRYRLFRPNRPTRRHGNILVRSLESQATKRSGKLLFFSLFALNSFQSYRQSPGEKDAVRVVPPFGVC